MLLVKTIFLANAKPFFPFIRNSRQRKQFLPKRKRFFYRLLHSGKGKQIFCLVEANIPANICWSWKRLQHVFSVTILRLARRLEDVLEDEKLLRWRRLEDTSWRHILKAFWRHVLKTSWKHYGDKQNTYWGHLYLTNVNVYVTNLYFTNLYLAILRRIQNALIRTHHFNIHHILELKQHPYFKN